MAISQKKILKKDKYNGPSISPSIGLVVCCTLNGWFVQRNVHSN